jgi:hypothetical protein
MGVQNRPANNQQASEDGSPDLSDRAVTFPDGGGEPPSQILIQKNSPTLQGSFLLAGAEPVDNSARSADD